MDFMDGSAGWSDAGVLIPYRIYKRYGDQKILENSYDAMKKYADFKIKTLGKWYPTAVRTGIDRKYKKYISNYGQSYGEWAEPTEVHITGFRDFACPHPEETTAYIVYMLETMAEIAEVLGKAEDQKHFSEYAEKGENRLRQTDRMSGIYARYRQTGKTRPTALHVAFGRKTNRICKKTPDYRARTL